MHKKNIAKPCIYILGTVVICLLGIFLPGLTLQRKNTAQINTSATLSSDYYSGTTPTISKNASSQLSSYEKMELISGVWESTTTEAPITEAALTEYEAIQLAQESLNILNENDVYPCSLSSGFKNWYTWTATLYKATDNNFHTYCAYYWKLNFNSYDSTEMHTVLMMEDGTILCAYTNQRSSRSITISEYMETYSLSSGSPFSIVRDNTSLDALPIYPNIDIPIEKLIIKDCSIFIMGKSDIKSSASLKREYYTENNGLQFYYIYQLVMRDNYVYTIIPYQP